MGSKNRVKAIKTKLTDNLKQINLNAAGIDTGSELIHVCVPDDRDENPVREFQSFTEDLHQLAAWLKECGVDTIAMESTSIYWIPLYDILERSGIEVNLVNPSHIKNVPGRKTDILDCQWIQQLHTYGLLRASVIPDQRIRELREFNKQREMLINQLHLISNTCKKNKRQRSSRQITLRQCARSLHHSDSALGAFIRRMRTKLGAPKAIVAAAHKLARIIYNMLKYQTEYNDIGAQTYNEIFKERRIKYLKRTAKKYGYVILPEITELQTAFVS